MLIILSGFTGCERPDEPRIEDLPPYLGRYPGALPPPERPRDPPPAANKIDATIVIDAGHGGRDPGAQGVSAAAEKEIVLSIAKKLAGMLEAYKAHVIMTRNDDRFITLDHRAATADRVQADLFVSIHADSAQRVGASGSTVYVARAASGQSRHAARKIVEALEGAGLECRGVRSAGFRVLVGHARPAVLVECGYLTNPGDARLLNTPAYQTRIATAITEGIVAHFTQP